MRSPSRIEPSPGGASLARLRRVFACACTTLALTLAVGCGDSTTDRGDAADGGADLPTGDAEVGDAEVGDAEVDSEAGVCPGGEESGLTRDDLLRSGRLNQTELVLIFESLQCIGEPAELMFRVSMTNHSCEIPGYELDMDQHVRVTTSDGVDFSEGLAFEVLSADDHHPMGLLTFQADRSGAPLIGCETDNISLEITGIDQGEGEGLTLSWEGSVLDGLRSCSD